MVRVEYGGDLKPGSVSLLFAYHFCSRVDKGATSQSPRGGGGRSFIADKLFISTRFGGALEILNFITCLGLYRAVLIVNYLFNSKILHPSPSKLNGEGNNVGCLKPLYRNEMCKHVTIKICKNNQIIMTNFYHGDSESREVKN